MKKHDAKQLAVLTTVGPDYIGYLACVTRFVADANGNIESQTCSQLGTAFVTSTLISADAESMRMIKATFKAQLKDLKPQLLETEHHVQSAANGDQIRCNLTVHCCEDSPSIVRQIADFLSPKQIDITSLAAATYPAPFQGTPMFAIEATIIVPHKTILRWLSASIEAWEARYGWDMHLNVCAHDDRYDSMMQPQSEPYPPSRLFQHTEVSKSESDDSATYPVMFN